MLASIETTRPMTSPIKFPSTSRTALPTTPKSDGVAASEPVGQGALLGARAPSCRADLSCKWNVRMWALTCSPCPLVRRARSAFVSCAAALCRPAVFYRREEATTIPLATYLRARVSTIQMMMKARSRIPSAEYRTKKVFPAFAFLFATQNGRNYCR
jgi:hypothetical protein